MIVKFVNSFVVCFLIMSVKTSLIFAQDSQNNILGIGFGGSNFHILDEHAAYLIFRGTGIAPSVIFSHCNRKNIHVLEGSFYHNNLSSFDDNYNTRILSGRFRYLYSRRMIKAAVFSNQLDISAGISITSFFMKSDYQFYLQTFWAKAIESWYGSHSIDVAAQFEYIFGEKDRIDISFFIPLISNVSRPAYSASGDYNYEKNDWDIKAFGEMMLIPGNLATNSKVSYRHNLTGKFLLNVEYEFCFARCRHPDMVRLYMNNLRLGLLYKF